MRTSVAWTDMPPERDGVRSVCHSLAHSPDGTQLVAGVGSRVLVYNASDGDLLHSLKGHKDAVYAVSYALDGKHFASGAADKTVIIWTNAGGGFLRYSHADAIQCLAYNPRGPELASATANEFGLWSPTQKAVAKHRCTGKVLSLAWTHDGTYLALGQFDGCVSVRDKAGHEKVKIATRGPCWSVSWAPKQRSVLVPVPDVDGYQNLRGGDDAHVCAVGCWDGTLSFYNLNGSPVGRAKRLGYDPNDVSFFGDGECVVVGGANKAVALVTKEGVDLVTISKHKSWVWCARQRPGHNAVAVGCDDGSVSMHTLGFGTVHGLHENRYAFRDAMTDVVVQHLVSGEKVRIKCGDLVTKIAVYKNQLAVQLPTCVILYHTLNPENDDDTRYAVTTKIERALECSLLVNTSGHLILCQEKKLQLLDFHGVLEREWGFESVVRYIKVVGGPPGKEGVLVGSKDGHIYKIFIDNPFPVVLVKHTSGIRCLDLSRDRGKVAAVDDTSSVVVYDVSTKTLVFEDKTRGANSLSWNAEFDDMLAYSGDGKLCVRTGDFTPHTQKLDGFVVGFKGSKVFCLDQTSVQTVDVPQSNSVMRYLERGEHDAAYAVACLGVADHDWRALGIHALDAMRLDVARKCFIRIRDMRFLELLNRVERGVKRGDGEAVFRAESLAYQGRFQEAAKAFAKAGHMEKAMEMFSDLRQFDEAKAWAETYSVNTGEDGGGMREFVHRQAEWAEESSDYGSAATMYVQAKQWDKAVALFGKMNNADKLVEVMRALGEGETKTLRKCAEHFARLGDTTHAREAYGKLNDHAGLIALFVKSEHWDDAFAALRLHPQFGDKVYLPYAGWLADHDRFDEARAAYQRAGKAELSTHMLEQLTHNAVLERRFKDAGYCYWLMSDEIASALRRAKNKNGVDVDLSPSHQTELDRFVEFKDRSEIYYAYDIVHRAMDEPFRTSLPSTLLNAGQFLVTKFSQRHEMPLGVSLAYVLITLATHGETLGAYKLTRFAYDKLQNLRVPKHLSHKVDLACVLSRAKPFTDAEELLPICFRCMSANPLVSGTGETCATCGGAFVRSFVTFEHLPMVEFFVEEGIAGKEARRLIEQEPIDLEPARASQPAGGGDVLGGDQKMFFDDHSGFDGTHDAEDPFTIAMGVLNTPIVCTREMLKALPPNDVVIRPSGCVHVPTRYFRVMDPDVPVTVDEAGNVFESDEYELACLEQGRTPFTRKPVFAETEMASAPPVEPDTPPAMQRTPSRGWGVAKGVASVQKMDFGNADENAKENANAGETKHEPGAAGGRSRRPRQA